MLQDRALFILMKAVNLPQTPQKVLLKLGIKNTIPEKDPRAKCKYVNEHKLWSPT